MVLRDAYFTCPVRAMIRGMRKFEPSLPTWIYRLNLILPYKDFPLMGDYHSCELRYVFNWGEDDWRDSDYDLSAQIGCYWASVRDMLDDKMDDGGDDGDATGLQ